MGCDCDCSWASSSTCGTDDGSCCFGCCCGSSPSPPSPGPGPSGGATYCLSANDLNVDYGTPQLNSNGWTINGGGRVSSKASFNFAGGFIEFDMDLANAHGNVNNNFYLTYPQDGHSYCDSGGSCTSCCAEFDLTENNGNCFQATTWHTDRSGGDHDGKAQTGGLSSQVHIKAAWNADGSQATVTVNGNQHSGEGFQDVMSQYGAVIYSSQWTGWVPGNCGGDGNLGLPLSAYRICALKVRLFKDQSLRNARPHQRQRQRQLQLHRQRQSHLRHHHQVLHRRRLMVVLAVLWRSVSNCALVMRVGTKLARRNVIDVAQKRWLFEGRRNM